MSKPKEFSFMTKDRLMTYTFIALLILAVLSYISFGFTSLIVAAIAVLVAVGIDFLLYKVAADSPLNIMSAAVFGLIVALSYSLGVPGMSSASPDAFILPLEAPDAYLYVAAISAVGMVIFKKLQGLAGRKFVNPAAAAKLVVMLPFLNSVLLVKEHLVNGPLVVPSLAGPIGYDVIGGNGAASFASYLQVCFANPTAGVSSAFSVEQLLLVQKWHGWVGGISSIAVIIVGLALFAICRRYIKWRITLTYLATVAVMAALLSAVYGGDMLLRVEFELFIGSSIFLAFFMATDPATTPLTYTGQGIFGVGLGVLTVLIQTYMGFLGGSILALVIMNLTSPILDKVGVPRPKAEKKEPKLPKAKQFATVKTYPCIRCGACMRVCCNKLSPVLIKEASDKKNMKKQMKLESDYCAGCENCNFVCPARINLRSYMLNYPMLEEDARKIEQQFLKGTADENIGVYTDMFSAKSSIEGQDGGVATSLLVSGMQRGLFDSAIVVQRKQGYWAEAVIAENVDEVLKAKGTKYIRVSMMSKLGDLIAKGKRKIAVVGTACEIRAARKIQQSLLGEYPDIELTLIGLFCFEEFNYEKLKEETKRLLGVDLDRAEKTQIRKGKYIVRVDGKDHSVSVRELNNAVENGCLSCPDFTANYSDISVGAVGSNDGYSTVIVRSDVGKKLVEKLDVTKGEVKKEEVTKLAIQKKNRAKQN